MSLTPTYAQRPSFLGVANADPISPVCVAGVPFDIGTTNRPGARFGPGAIRKASGMLVDGQNPLGWYDPSASGLADIGDFPTALGDILASYKLIEEAAAPIRHLITLGGDHGITLALLRALARKTGPVALVHFDAHVDTWPDSFGQPWGHGSVFWHAIREGLVDPKRMIQIGIRSPVQREVWDWTIDQGVTILPADDANSLTPAAIAAQIRGVVGDAPTYLSFDIDALDPAFAPGTGTPEIGGLSSGHARGVIKRLDGINWVGMDLVEVAPVYDQSEITALAGATMVWEYLALLGKA
jgi:agmatinase